MKYFEVSSDINMYFNNKSYRKNSKSYKLIILIPT